MARVPYVDPPAPGAPDPDGLRDLYAEIGATRGSVLDLHRALAGAPEALRAYFRLSRYVRDESSLDPRLRELAIVATGYVLGVPYELAHHVPAARRAGVTKEQPEKLSPRPTLSPRPVARRTRAPRPSGT